MSTKKIIWAVTRKGYLRGLVGRRLVMQHVYVWENANGPIPAGYQIHHINEDKQDNRIDNLQLVTPTEHKRIHTGCKLRDGVWWKPCNVCKGIFPIDEANFYISKEGWPLFGRCRSCHIKIVVRDKKLRRLRNKSK